MKKFMAEVCNYHNENNVDFIVKAKSVTDKELEFFVQPEIGDGEITKLSTPDSMGDELFLVEYEVEVIEAMQKALNEWQE